MKVKICGITSEKEAVYLNEAGADFAGMVLFFPKSKRNIDIDTAKLIMKALDSSIKKTAVVVSPTVQQVKDIKEAGFDYIQIHGQLEQAVLEETEIPIIRAFNITNMNETVVWKDNKRIAGFLFDAADPGSGRVFDWNILHHVDCSGKLLFLAGGLTPENVREAVLAVHPDCVDVSSGVEQDSGFGKDRDKIKAFVRKAKAML